MPLARAGRARSSSTVTAGCRFRSALKRAERPCRPRISTRARPRPGARQSGRPVPGETGGNLARTPGACGASQFSRRCGAGGPRLGGLDLMERGARTHPVRWHVAALELPLKTLGKAPARSVASSPKTKKPCLNDRQGWPLRSTGMSMSAPWRGRSIMPSCLPRRISLSRRIPSSWDCSPPRAFQIREAAPFAWRSG